MKNEILNNLAERITKEVKNKCMRYGIEATSSTIILTSEEVDAIINSEDFEKTLKNILKGEWYWEIDDEDDNIVLDVSYCEEVED
jgi:hypothetical protein|nr:MAG TPA: hypothetical protein [Caudoviricetes sp.]